MTGNIEVQVLVDVVFSNAGSIIVFTPLTPAGEQWFDENVASEDWQWMGPSLCVDHRPALELLAGIAESGLRVADASVHRVLVATGRAARA